MIIDWSIPLTALAAGVLMLVGYGLAVCVAGAHRVLSMTTWRSPLDVESALMVGVRHGYLIGSLMTILVGLFVWLMVKG